MNEEQLVEEGNWESLDINAPKEGETVRPALSGFGRILTYT
jgi:hypothetical protein